MAKMLRKRGIDAYLILYDNEYKYFLPEHEDTELKDNYPDWIKRVHWGSARSFFLTKSSIVRDDLDNFDVYICCGYGPAFLQKAGIEKYIFLPYGGDLVYLPYPVEQLKSGGFIKGFLRIFHSPHLFFLSLLQKKAIQKSKAICIVLVDEYFIEPLKNLEICDKIIQLGLSIDTEKFSSISVHSYLEGSKDENFRRILSLKNKSKLIVFSPTRHFWTAESIRLDRISNKANDVLIEGFANLPVDSDSLLILVEKGPDVIRSKKLIQTLGIENRVIWVPEMPRENLIQYYLISDISVDQMVPLGYGSIALEVFALSKPLMTNIADNFEKISQRPLPPILNISTADDITNFFTDFIRDPEKYRIIGKNARTWVEKYHGYGLIDDYIQLFHHISEGKDLNDFKKPDK